jgi:hypothetical protein
LNKAAVGESRGSILLYIDPGHSGDNRPQFAAGRDAVQVPCVKLDDYVYSREMNALHFLKIDIQGSDVAAIEGAKNAIHGFRPLILMEIDRDFQGAGGEDINQYIVRFVKEFRYKPYCVSDNRPKLLSGRDMETYAGNIFLEPI